MNTVKKTNRGRQITTVTVSKNRRGNGRDRRSGRSAQGSRGQQSVTDLPVFRGREGRVGNPLDGIITNTFIPAFNTQRYRGKLRYGANALASTGLVSQVSRYVFSANGLFDPNITGGGLQPAGFAQLMLNYNHYTVLRSKITVIVNNKSTVPATIGLAVMGDLTGSTDQNNMFELPRENLTYLDPAGQHGAIKILSAVCDIAQFQGVDDPVDNPDLQGNLIANPVEQSYFHLLGCNLDGSASSFSFAVVIDYDAMFQEPRELSPSLTAAMLTAAEQADRDKCRTRMDLNHPLFTKMKI